MAPQAQKPDLEERVGVVEEKVDEVRAVFGLNGHKSPEAVAEAASTWRELRAMALRDAQARRALGWEETSPEVMAEAVQTWKDMVEMVKRDRAVKELRESYREVRADVARRMAWMRRPWSIVKWLVIAGAGALISANAWHFAGLMHIQTPWGTT